MKWYCRWCRNPAIHQGWWWSNFSFGFHTSQVVATQRFFSPRNLGKMNPFWRSYFSDGLKPPTSDGSEIRRENHLLSMKHTSWTMGSTTTPYLVIAGFLNHQHYDKQLLPLDRTPILVGKLPSLGIRCPQASSIWFKPAGPVHKRQRAPGTLSKLPETQVNNEKRALGCLGFIGDNILSSYVGIIKTSQTMKQALQHPH